MKQTAVEWLEAIIKHCERFGTNVEQKDIDQAKEMEKEQIIEAFEHVDFNLDDGLHYYTETFKSE